MPAGGSPPTPVEVAHAFGDLPTLAPVAVEVLRLADDDRASLEDIADVIGHDSALSAQLLRVANSAVYGMGTRTTSLSRAASVLGLRTVKLLSLRKKREAVTLFPVVSPADLSLGLGGTWGR